MDHRRWRAALCSAASLLSWVAAPTAVAAPLAVQGAFSSSIAPSSPCVIEPRSALWENLGTYDPSVATQWSTSSAEGNHPAFDDVMSQTQAGTFADSCVAFRLPPDMKTRGAAPQDRDPATDPLTGDDVRDVRVTLPTGFGARLKGLPTCSDEDFDLVPDRWITWNGSALAFVGTPVGTSYEAAPVFDSVSSCAPSTMVGEAVVRLGTSFGARQRVAAGGSVSFESSATGDLEPPEGTVFLLEPGPNALARLGVQIQVTRLSTPTRFVITVGLAEDSSGRLVAVARDAPRATAITSTTPARPAALYLETVALRLFGRAEDHPGGPVASPDGLAAESAALAQDFAETPTQCAAALSTTVDVTTYGGSSVTPLSSYPAATASNVDSPGVQMTGCDQLPFAPAVDVDVVERRPGVPTAATVRVRVDQSAVGGRLPSHLRDASVTLPAGLELGGQVASDADGLQFCSAAQFAASDASVAAGCAAATEAASVAITSPLIDRQFTGKVFLGEPASGEVLPQLFLEATLAGSSGADAPRIKLVGSVSADADGRLTTVFSDAPQLRFSELTLTFPGGDHALFSTAPRCGSTSGSARMSPWSGQPDVSVATSAVVIDEGCAGAAAPKISVAASNPKAGVKSPVSVTIERDSSAPWMDSVNAHLPPGFLADLNAAAECPAADAATGNCGADSKIGTVTTWAGAGTKPYEISGDLFLAERKGTDVAGAVIVVDAQVGDLDLGKVIVPGRILLRATDAGLDFISDVPLRVQGVALQLQKVQVDLDRPNFALNPSACGPLAASVELTDDQSVVTTGTGTATYTGCKELGFAPKLQAILTGDNTPGGHPGMYVVLTSPEGDAGMKSAAVTLPDGVVADRANVQSSRTCSVAQFNAGSCPAVAKIGTAMAEVSIVPEQLTGTIYLVTIPGKSLPGLGVDFGGRYAQRVLSTVSTDRENRLVTTFAAIPDLPLRRLVIDVASSPKSPLQISETSPCDANSGWQGVFTAQGGQSSTSKTGLQCAAQPKTTLSAKAGLSFRLFDFGTRNLSYLKISLPKGWSINAKAAKRPDAVWVRATGGSATIKLAKRSLFVNATGKPTDVRLKIGAAVLKGPRKLKKGSKVTLPVRLAFTDGTIQQQTISLTLK